MSSLYTNIPHEEGTKACREFLLKHHSPSRTNELCSLIEFILKNNYFQFHDRFYHQINGTAMGTKMAPSFANLFMASLDQPLFEASPKKPTFYVRYIDDVFLIWPHGLQELLNFKNFVNSFHCTIKFTMEYSQSHLPFLDTVVHLTGSSLETSLFTKPTDSHCYLQFESFHPPHIKHSIIFSQFLRIKRICSTEVDQSRHMIEFAGYLLNRGYPFKLIDKYFRKVQPMDRDSLLLYRSRTENKRIPLTITYHPKLSPLLKRIKTSWRNLSLDPSIREVFNEPPIVAFSQPRNLRGLLVHTRLNPTPDTPTGGNSPCGSKRCQVCDHMITERTVHVQPKGIQFSPGPYSCNSSNVIYLLLCKKCPLISYIGETSSKFRFRFNNHKASIRNKSTGLPVAEHFNTPNHSVQDLKFSILMGGFTNTEARKKQELRLIFKCDSHVHGLNRDLSFMANKRDH